MFRFSPNDNLLEVVSILVRSTCGSDAVCWVGWLCVPLTLKTGPASFLNRFSSPSCLPLSYSKCNQVWQGPSLKCNQGKRSCQLLITASKPMPGSISLDDTSGTGLEYQKGRWTRSRETSTSLSQAVNSRLKTVPLSLLALSRRWRQQGLPGSKVMVHIRGHPDTLSD